MSRLPIVLCLFLLTTSALSAQVPRVSAGDTVRLKSPVATGRLAVLAVSAGALAVEDSAGGVSHVPWESIERLSVHRGRRSQGRGFLRGAGIGLAVGAGTGIVVGLASGDDPPETWFSFTAEEKALMAGVLLGSAGGVLGGLIGLAVPGDRWERVQVDMPMTNAGRGGVQVRYTHRF